MKAELIVGDLGVDIKLDLKPEVARKVITLFMQGSVVEFDEPQSVQIVVPQEVAEPVVRKLEKEITKVPVMPLVSREPIVVPKPIAQRPKIQIQHPDNTPVYISGEEDKPETPFALLLQANPFATNEYFLNEKVVAYTCPDCYKTSVRKVALGVDNKVVCRHCEREVEITEVAKKVGECKCHNRVYLQATENVKELKCIKCGDQIQLARQEVRK